MCSKMYETFQALIETDSHECATIICSVRVYAVIISKYATKIVGKQNRQVACVHGTQDQMQSTFSKFKPAQ